MLKKIFLLVVFLFLLKFLLLKKIVIQINQIIILKKKSARIMLNIKKQILLPREAILNLY